MTEGHVVYPSNPSQNPSHTSYSSYPPYHDSLSNRTEKAWHPKITPYRLAILTTTVGLGTAKAIVTQNGGAIVSTTLEWVAGTFLSVIFFALSAYEAREDVPSSLSWLFKPDCMDLVWKLLALFSIDRPEYVSDEFTSDSTSYFKPANPDITPYRIIVCSSVIAFGLSKAMLGYANQSAAATWTDWAIGVPITTLLYILGLYEYNSSNVLPGFFSRDQSEVLYSVNRGMMYSVGIVLSSAWTALWTYILYQFTTDPQWDFGSLPEDRSMVTMEEYFESWQAAGFKFWLQECFLAVIGLGIFAILQLSRPAANNIIAKSGVLRRIIRAIRRPIFMALRLVFPSMDDDPLSISIQTSNTIRTNWERTKSFLRIAFHLTFHMSGVIFMLSFSMVSILAGIVTVFKHSWRDPAVFFVMPMWVILGIMLPFAAYNIWRSMLATLPTLL